MIGVIKQQNVAKMVLDNGLTILVYPDVRVPKVAMQLWYGVGSKYEHSGQHGFSHFIEHLMFKGTQHLSESDISLITTKLSGSCNAFTSYDYTAYEFELPSQNWHHALDILADCMVHAAFKQELMNSELKTVIQELKMYRDNHETSAVELALNVIFATHPYHYPIIGTKHDLLNFTRDDLVAFYHRHYVPDNAALVVVGDVKIDEVMARAQKVFGKLKPGNHVRENFICKSDVVRASITLQRDVQQPVLFYAAAVPGVTTDIYRSDYAVDALSWIIASGRGSRLYKKLVEQKRLAAGVDAFYNDLFDQGVLFIQIQPRDQEAIAQIDDIVRAECLATDFSLDELARAHAKLTAEHLAMRESTMRLAYTIGRQYLAFGNCDHALEYLNVDAARAAQSIHDVATQYLRSSVLHDVRVIPLSDIDKKFWLIDQRIADGCDECALAKRVRVAPIEAACAANTIIPGKRKKFEFPHFQLLVLSNGLEVLYHRDEAFEKIEAIFEFEGDHLYDPADRQGMSSFVSHMLTKGTATYTATQLADVVESLGMSLEASSGFLSLGMLSKDFDKGMSIIADVVCNSAFAPDVVEDERANMRAQLLEILDDPYWLCEQLARQQVYAGHPCSYNRYGTVESLAKITREELVHFYHTYINPRAARLALVGNLPEHGLRELLENSLGCWQGAQISELKFPRLEHVKQQQINHYLNRDQATLAVAGLSVTREDPDFDALLVFDQVFGSGVLGSMSSRLFQLRERSGLFYRISGSVIARVDKQPGMVLVKTTVSLDRLKEAQQAINRIIDQAAQTLCEDEVRRSKDALANSVVDLFANYHHMAFAFLQLRKFGRPADYYDKRAAQLEAVTLEDIKRATARVMHSDNMVSVRVGRLGNG